MKAIVSDKHRFIIIMINKNATRSLLDYFIRKPKYDYGAKTLVGVPRNKYLSYPTLAIVRNPYHRTVSCYINKVINPWSNVVESILKPHRLKPNISFEEFVEYLSSHPHGTDIKGDLHWRSQHKMFPGTAIPNLTIAKLEGIGGQGCPFQAFMRAMGCPDIPLRHLNYGVEKGRYEREKGYYKDMPKEHKGYDWKGYYKDQDTADKVWERYRKDFEGFDYERLIVE